jgi:hypothetical protein
MIIKGRDKAKNLKQKEKEMSKKIIILVFFISLFLFSGSVLAGGSNMKEGLWEITMTMEIPKMPMKMPPRTWTQCVTKKDCVPQEEKDCKVIKSEFKDDFFTWVIEVKKSKKALQLAKVEGSIKEIPLKGL